MSFSKRSHIPTRSLKIYGAGKIAKHDWRFGGGRVESPYFEKSVKEDRDATRHLMRRGSFDWLYVGPWFKGCDHGCTHVPNSHAATYVCGTGEVRESGIGEGFIGEVSLEALFSNPGRDFHKTQNMVLSNCLAQIQKCDVFYARIDSPTAYGTFAEIGYAYALGKPVYLDIRDTGIAPDLWFMLRMSLASPLRENVLRSLPWMDFQGTLQEYEEKLLGLMQNEYPFPSEPSPIEAEAPCEDSEGGLPPELEHQVRHLLGS